MNSLLNDHLLNRVVKPALVKLFVRVAPRSLDVMLFNPYEERSLESFSLPVDSRVDDSREYLRSLENLIYRHPKLIEYEWSSVEILYDAGRFALVPVELPEPEKAFKLTYGPASAGCSLVTHRDELTGVTIVAEISDGLLSFLRRTLVNAPIMPAIVTTARYCAARSVGSSPVMTVNYSAEGSMQIVTTSGGRLLQATRFDVANPDDAAYYALATAKALPEMPDEISVTGTSTRRNDLMTILRRFHNYVMPLVFPSEMHRAGAEVGEIEFDLMIMPLCTSQSKTQSPK